jgi:hypothetical protein
MGANAVGDVVVCGDVSGRRSSNPVAIPGSSTRAVRAGSTAARRPLLSYSRAAALSFTATPCLRDIRLRRPAIVAVEATGRAVYREPVQSGKLAELTSSRIVAVDEPSALITVSPVRLPNTR